MKVFKPLSPREKEILELYRGGATVTGIADELGLSVKTVSTYLTRAQDKMGLSTRWELRNANANQSL